jgi:hypothetical protein
MNLSEPVTVLTSKVLVFLGVSRAANTAHLVTCYFVSSNAVLGCEALPDTHWGYAACFYLARPRSV